MSSCWCGTCRDGLNLLEEIWQGWYERDKAKSPEEYPTFKEWVRKTDPLGIREDNHDEN